MLQVYCSYDGTRNVDPGYKKSVFGSRPFGVHMDVAQLMAKQVRMERQDAPNMSAVSFDRFAAHAFQAYVQSALAFSIKRCGLLYGRVEETEDEEKVVYVDAIYEPEQEGKAETMKFDLTNEQVCGSVLYGLCEACVRTNLPRSSMVYIFSAPTCCNACPPTHADF